MTDDMNYVEVNEYETFNFEKEFEELKKQAKDVQDSN